ncbi:cytochrome oxidase putative small subunit CydP [Endothiovibrio diazotrophicus]
MTPLRWNRFRREIAAVLLIKAVALAVIWNLFFSRPLDAHLSDAKIGDYLFQPAAHQRPVENR